MVDVQQVLRPLQQFEEKLGELYAWFAEIYGTDPEVCSLFRRLALDEKSHAGQVDYLRRLVRQNPNLWPRIELDLAEVFSGMDRVGQVRRAAQPPTVSEALRLALELESSAADYHYRNALAQLNPQVSKLLGSLGRADRLHYERLLDVAQRRGLLGPDTPVPPPPPQL